MCCKVAKKFSKLKVDYQVPDWLQQKGRAQQNGSLLNLCRRNEGKLEKSDRYHFLQLFEVIKSSSNSSSQSDLRKTAVKGNRHSYIW